jgi:hypothetical protein
METAILPIILAGQNQAFIGRQHAKSGVKSRQFVIVSMSFFVSVSLIIVLVMALILIS